MPRIKKFGKRRVTYVRNFVNSSVNSEENSEHVIVPSLSSVSCRPTSPDSETNAGSSSKKKLKSLQYCAENSEYFEKRFKDGNVIVNLNTLSEAITNFAVCKLCTKALSLELFENVDKRKGIVSNLQLVCNNCDASTSFVTCGKNVNGFYENNLRLVYGMRSIGKGNAAARTLCSVMNLPQPPRRFESYNKELGKSIINVAKRSMDSAKREAVNENDNGNNISVIFDGTWQKRGHTSLNGVVTVTSLDTGKVLDVECMSKYCNKCYGKNIMNHEGCVANYSGTSGGMEVAGVTKIYERSVVENQVRYTNYLGDGDSKAFETVKNLKPYGDEVVISKLECVGHIQKRMGGRLRRLKLANKKKLLSDGKPLTGKGRLTDSVINDLQSYYGLAIRNNCDSVDSMKRAVWAIFFHKGSTIEKPSHGLCPKGVTSWCKYNRSIAQERPLPEPTNTLPSAVLQVIRPTFQDLSDPVLLKKCVHGKTQNQNESFNNMVWSRILKNNFVGLSTLQIGAYDAVVCYNEGALGKVRVLEELIGRCGANCVVGLKQQDQRRVYQAEIAMKDIEKRALQARENVKRRLLENKEDSDDPDYGYGAH